MAVHLNARLGTRFIPVLFLIALLWATFTTSMVRAEDAPEDLGLDDATGMHEIMQQDLRDLTAHSYPERVDRKPGFSPIRYSKENASAAGAVKNEEPIETDQLSVQPPEAQPQE